MGGPRNPLRMSRCLSTKWFIISNYPRTNDTPALQSGNSLHTKPKRNGLISLARAWKVNLASIHSVSLLNRCAIEFVRLELTDSQSHRWAQNSLSTIRTPTGPHGNACRIDIYGKHQAIGPFR